MTGRFPPKQAAARIAARSPPKRIGLAGWFFLVLFTIFVYQCTTSSLRHDERVASVTPEQKEYEAQQQRLSDAKWQCREFMKRALKAPATASFQNYNEFTARPNGPGEYTVDGYVDSQNSFGTMVRMNFTCEVKRSDTNNWSLLNLAAN